MPPRERAAHAVPSSRMTCACRDANHRVRRRQRYSRGAVVDACALAVLVIAQGEEAPGLREEQAVPPARSHLGHARGGPTPCSSPQVPHARGVATRRPQATEEQDLALSRQHEAVGAAAGDNTHWTRLRRRILLRGILVLKTAALQPRELCRRGDDFRRRAGAVTLPRARRRVRAQEAPTIHPAANHRKRVVGAEGNGLDEGLPGAIARCRGREEHRRCVPPPRVVSTRNTQLPKGAAAKGEKGDG
mmetsp:Transcript_79729/g.205095  ORF Transcript_79729/g.205095 Transcript_79729/m.205095 type:complete len:246 (+) Transcript_79729:879-1616(+)